MAGGVLDYARLLVPYPTNSLVRAAGGLTNAVPAELSPQNTDY